MYLLYGNSIQKSTDLYYFFDNAKHFCKYKEQTCCVKVHRAQCNASNNAKTAFTKANVSVMCGIWPRPFIHTYLRIDEIATASSSENTGTALLLCNVAMPSILVPVYTFCGASGALPMPVSRLGTRFSCPRYE